MNEDELINGMEIAAKRGAQYNIEVINEELIPTLMILTENNRIELAHINAEYDEFPSVLEEVLSSTQAKAYALILEAWQTQFVERALELDGRVRDMPPDDRFEVSTLMLVKRNEGLLKYITARIDTQSDGRRTLQDWVPALVRDQKICITEW